MYSGFTLPRRKTLWPACHAYRRPSHCTGRPAAPQSPARGRRLTRGRLTDASGAAGSSPPQASRIMVHRRASQQPCASTCDRRLPRGPAQRHSSLVMSSGPGLGAGGLVSREVGPRKRPQAQFDHALHPVGSVGPRRGWARAQCAPVRWTSVIHDRFASADSLHLGLQRDRRPAAHRRAAPRHRAPETTSSEPQVPAGAPAQAGGTAGTKQCQRWVERLTAEPKSGSTPICFSMMLTTG